MSVANSGGDAFLVAFTRTDAHTTPVSQATTRPDPELMRLRQADEGHVFPTAVGWIEEGVIPNGLSLLSEGHSDPYLPVGESSRTRCKASHLTREGCGYRNEIWKKKQLRQSEKYNQHATREG